MASSEMEEKSMVECVTSRGVLEVTDKLYLGFSNESYQDIFQTEST